MLDPYSMEPDRASYGSEAGLVEIDSEVYVLVSVLKLDQRLASRC
jgi:hypothetical protein